MIVQMKTKNGASAFYIERVSWQCSIAKLVSVLTFLFHKISSVEDNVRLIGSFQLGGQRNGEVRKESRKGVCRQIVKKVPYLTVW